LFLNGLHLYCKQCFRFVYMTPLSSWCSGHHYLRNTSKHNLTSFSPIPNSKTQTEDTRSRHQSRQPAAKTGNLNRVFLSKKKERGLLLKIRAPYCHNSLGNLYQYGFWNHVSKISLIFLFFLAHFIYKPVFPSAIGHRLFKRCENFSYIIIIIIIIIIISQSLKILNLHPNTYIQMKKSAVLGTCSIVRNFLNYK
jgi:hypothetical protein